MIVGQALADNSSFIDSFIIVSFEVWILRLSQLTSRQRPIAKAAEKNNELIIPKMANEDHYQ